jgi:dolichol-phosphate mannosyltransferase
MRVREVPITFVERTSGSSKMSRKIVAEALWRVTAWGVDDKVTRIRRRSHSRRAGGAP